MKRPDAEAPLAVSWGLGGWPMQSTGQLKVNNINKHITVQVLRYPPSEPHSYIADLPTSFLPADQSSSHLRSLVTQQTTPKAGV